MRISWLSLADAVNASGLNQDQIIGRARRGTIKRKAKDGIYLYGIEEKSAPKQKVTAAPKAPKEVVTTLFDVKHDDLGGHGPDYVYDETRNRYIFSLRSKANAGRPLILTSDTVEQMVLAYSRDGGDATINAISRAFGLHRSSTREVLRALGRTHDSAPFTDEQLAKRSEEDLGEDLIRLKEEKVLRHAERVQWAETKRLADQARNLNRFVFDKMEALLKDPAPRPAVSVSISGARTVAPFTCVFGLTDLHFGAIGWKKEVGEEITREIVRKRTIETTKRVIERVLKIGKPARWLLPSGSDNIHADTDLGTTTKGTPLDTDGSFARMFIEGCDLYSEVIELLAAVAPVTVVAMPGNHDRIASMMLTHWLGAHFRHDDRVTVGSAVEHRSYHLFGKSLIGFAHGDGLKDDKLPLTMASEAREQWGAAKHTMILTGHLHTDRSNEFSGTRVIHMPCLATADRWHHRNAYTKNTKAIAAYCVDDEEGLIATLPVQPPASTDG